MTLLPGVYYSPKKDGTPSYRSSITYQNKHISLGSYPEEALAHKAYSEARLLLDSDFYTIDNYQPQFVLSFDKWVVLINFRDNKVYIKTPIYLQHKYFIYCINPSSFLKFDVDDLFYYSNHKIIKRGGYLFVSDFGMQTNILSRYGIKNFAVAGKDYRFVNGDTTDYRYGNIEIINRYHGVTKTLKNGIPIYIAKIHVNGDTIIGRYSTENEAAVAYNKAAQLLQQLGLKKDFPLNYILEMNEIEYAKTYNRVRLSPKIRNFKL